MCLEAARNFTTVVYFNFRSVTLNSATKKVKLSEMFRKIWLLSYVYREIFL